jgi:hypothetical protein
MRSRGEAREEALRLLAQAAGRCLPPLESLTEQDVVKAFRRGALRLHPDKGGCKVEFQRLQEAVEELLSFVADPPQATWSEEDEEQARRRAKKAAKQRAQKEKRIAHVFVILEQAEVARLLPQQLDVLRGAAKDAKAARKARGAGELQDWERAVLAFFKAFDRGIDATASAAKAWAVLREPEDQRCVLPLGDGCQDDGEASRSSE